MPAMYFMVVKPSSLTTCAYPVQGPQVFCITTRPNGLFGNTVTGTIYRLMGTCSLFIQLNMSVDSASVGHLALHFTPTEVGLQSAVRCNWGTL